jgi:hypothetical protein
VCGMWDHSFLTSLTRTDRLLQILNRLLLAAETVALLVMQPAKLLKDLCMLRISVEHTSIGRLGIVVLKRSSELGHCNWKSIDLHLSAAHGHVQSGTRCPLQSEGSVARKQCIGSTANNERRRNVGILLQAALLTSRLCWYFCCCL